MLKNIVSIRDTGIFKDFRTGPATPQLRKLNLIYGYNGSGKTTLARIFACLQLGSLHPKLPTTTTFDFELDDGRHLRTPADLSGYQRRVLVFNSDFVDANLQWASGTASPIFYIGREQADLAKTMSDREAALPAAIAAKDVAASALASAEKTLAVFKRERARTIANDLFLRGRKYEAPDLTKDFVGGEFNQDSLRTPDQLDALRALLRLDAPLPKLDPIEFDLPAAQAAVEAVRHIAGKSLSAVMLQELHDHPAMAGWLKHGADYHASQDLQKCLLCANDFGADRKALLASALDDGFGRHLNAITDTIAEVEALENNLALVERALPQSQLVSADQRSAYNPARDALKEALKSAEQIFAVAREILGQKAISPSVVVPAGSLISEMDQLVWSGLLKEAILRINRVIDAHNATFDAFEARQTAARKGIKAHYLAESDVEYREFESTLVAARSALATSTEAAEAVTAALATVRQQIQEHGQAAEKINQLIGSYLGHNELAIVPVPEGYEIHRHGESIEGLPSEGEKTAVALCYFISTLEAEGRAARDLIVIVDDPISSLDTKALNFACSLIKSRLLNVAQLIVLTHNQQCMNEFKKAWKGKIERRGETEPTAALFFLEVCVPKGEARRVSRIVEMSRLLREYESEYHFFFSKLLIFSKEGDESEYAYMMPNILRKVLEVFLAFKCPGNSGLAGKVQEIGAGDFGIDTDRLAALERLAQIESHSDNLDDLIGFSSMTLEEVKGAADSLLVMMEAVDKTHFDKICRICR